MRPPALRAWVMGSEDDVSPFSWLLNESGTTSTSSTANMPRPLLGPEWGVSRH